jgi:hypothetical protein
MSEEKEEILKWAQKFSEGKVTLYDALGIFLHKPYPLPDWIVHAIEQGFSDRIDGKRTLDSVFGLSPKPGAQVDKAARRLAYSAHVYHEVVRRHAAGEPIGELMYDAIAEEKRPGMIADKWPGARPAVSGRTIKEWYLQELHQREPFLAGKRNKKSGKTPKSKTD